MAARMKVSDWQARIDSESSDKWRCYEAMNAAIEDRVKWFGRGVYRLGVVNPTGPHGGLVVVRFNPGGQAPHSVVYQWETWWPSVRDTEAIHEESRALRDLVYEAHTYVSQAHDAAGVKYAA